MRLGLFIGLTQKVGSVTPGIVVVTPPYLNPALLRVGDQVGGAFVSGSYSWAGGPVTEGSPTYTVNGVTKASNYVLLAGDIVAAAAVGLTGSGAPSITVYAEPTDVTDFSYTTSDFEYTVPAGAGDSTAPTLSAPTATANGATAIDGTVDTTEGNGTLWIIAYDSGHSAPANGAAVKAGNDGSGAALKSMSQAVMASGTQNVALTGVSGAASTYKVAYAHEDAYGNMSNVAIISGTVLLAVAPVLTTPTGVALRCLAGTAGATTDQGDGTMYTVYTTGITTPSAAQVIAGQDSAGATAVASASLAISSTGAKVISVSGGTIAPGASYYAHTVHQNQYGQNSNVVTSAQFTMKNITFIGFTANSGTAATYDIDLTTIDTTNGGIGGPLLQGDFGIAATGWSASNADGNPGISGWTELDDLYGNDETRDVNLSVAWKVMGSTPDSVATVTAPNNAAEGACGVIAWYRYVDPTTPIHVQGTAVTGKDTALADPPSITPTLAGSLVVEAVAAAGDTTPADLVQSTGFTLAGRRKTGGSTRGARFLIAHQAWTSGAVDPAAITSGESVTNDSWAANTYALKPY